MPRDGSNRLLTGCIAYDDVQLTVARSEPELANYRGR